MRIFELRAGDVERRSKGSSQASNRSCHQRCFSECSPCLVTKSSSSVLVGAPTITVEPAETVVDAGTTIVLSCQAEGEPTPMIEWSRQGRPLLGNDRFSSLSNGSLRISSAQKEDTAEYECVARNMLGSVLVRVTLTVGGELYIVGLSFSTIFFGST